MVLQVRADTPHIPDDIDAGLQQHLPRADAGPLQYLDEPIDPAARMISPRQAAF